MNPSKRIVHFKTRIKSTSNDLLVFGFLLRRRERTSVELPMGQDHSGCLDHGTQASGQGEERSSD